MGTETPSQGTFRYSLRNIPPKAEWDVPAMQKAYKAALADGSLCEERRHPGAGATWRRSDVFGNLVRVTGNRDVRGLKRLPHFDA